MVAALRTKGKHGVVFLARGASSGDGTGLDAARDFFASYQAHPAGLEHELIVAAKAWNNADRCELGALAARYGATIIDLPDDGYDWAAYGRAAQRLSHEKLCFFNTHSRIQAHDWLVKLNAGLDMRGVAAAGATGSWGTVAPVFRFVAPSAIDIGRNRGWLRGAYSLTHGYALFPLRRMLAARRFPQFPNPHLRSNAFIIARSLFQEFMARSDVPRSKHDAFALESGRNGLSRFFNAKGLRPVVVTANGRTVDASAWDDCGVFRCPGQPALMVNDNQTRAYDATTGDVRRVMERAAWGRTFTPAEAQSKLVANLLS